MASIDYTLTRGDEDEEIDVTIEYSWHRACVGATDGRHGPKIEPDEPAHFEIESVTRNDNGMEVETTDPEDEEIYDLLASIADDRDCD